MSKEQQKQLNQDLEDYGAYLERLRFISWLKNFQALDATVTVTRGNDSVVIDIFGTMIRTLEKEPTPKLLKEFDELRQIFPGTDDELTEWLESLPEVNK